MTGRPSGPPRRALSQNFLVDANIQAKIVAAVPTDVDRIVEIGPGRGALTEHLLKRQQPLTVVEVDRDLAAWWRSRAEEYPHLTVVEGDATEVELARLGDPARMAVVGNLPYHVTSPLIFRLLERPRPRDIVVMVQKEVADRLAAVEGTSGYGALTVGVQTVAAVERLFRVPRTVFRPRPSVDSAVVRLRPHAPPETSEDDERGTRRLVRAAFSWRRKQMVKILRDHPELGLHPEEAARALAALDLPPHVRPERLPPPTFVALARLIAPLR